MTLEQLMAVDKDTAENAAKTMIQEDITQLVEFLAEKDDKIRYPSFLVLLERSRIAGDVYPYWDVFEGKLRSGNSFQRNIGLLMIAENARWDYKNKLDDVMQLYLSILNDEKPITVRQCIQGLEKIVPYKKHLHRLIARSLMALDILSLRETMQKVILLDILHVLAMIRRVETDSEIEGYISGALMGGILDKKSKKLLEETL